MVLCNPNNWHWVSKDASAWARGYLEELLSHVSAEEVDVSAKVDKLLSMEGDVDVSQRKGKVITLFDIKLKLEYSGNAAGESVRGSITVFDLAHDSEANEYVFEVDVYSDGKSKQPVKDLVRAQIIPQIREKLVKLGPALIAEHGKDIQHAPGPNPSSGIATPTYESSSHAQGKSTSAASIHTQGTSKVNVTTVKDTAEFRTTAAELYQTFTDPQRLSAFTRAPPNVFEGAKEGGKYELFGGNVAGEFVELVEPTKIVQLWRLKQWPTGHYSKLEIVFDQNDLDSVTVMRVNWDGVPVGQEEVTKRNWGEYYVRSIKMTFGFGTVL